MPQITVNGRAVTVDDSFMKLSPEEQNSTVEEIASSMPQQSYAEKAISAATAPIANISSHYSEIKSGGLAKIREALAAMRAEGVRMGQEAKSQGIALTPGGPIIPAAVPSVVNPSPAVSALSGMAQGATAVAGAPLGAPFRSIVSQPIEDVTHGYLPREGTEFIGAMVAPELATPALNAAARFARNRVAREPLALKPEELKASAAHNFNAPEVTETTLHPQAVQQFYEGLPATLETKGHATDVIAPQTYAQVGQYARRAAGQQEPITINQLRDQRAVLQGIAQTSTVPKERAAATTAIKSLDEFIANPQFANFPGLRGEATGSGAEATTALETARGNYATAMSLEKLDRKQFIKELRAASSDSGLNTGNRLRQGIVELMANERTFRNLKPEVRDAMENVVRGNAGEDTVRFLSNILGGGGGIGNTGVRFVGAKLAGPLGAFLPEVGTALRILSNRMTVQEFDKLRTLIASNSPLGKSIKNAMEGYAKNAEFTLSSRWNPTSLAPVKASADVLARELNKAGIQFGPIPVPAQNKE